jgi:predicted amidophosphoribosyltransferase
MEADVVAWDKKMKTMNCPLCKKGLYSEVGNGCKMCGMPLENNDEEFCSKSCRTKYNNINKLRQIRKNYG